MGKKEEDRAEEKDKVRKGEVGRKRERCRRWIEGILEWRRIWEERGKRKNRREKTGGGRPQRC